MEGRKIWHELVISCPRCGKRIHYETIAFSADGQILIHGRCLRCNIPVGHEGELVEIMAKSFSDNKPLEIRRPSLSPCGEKRKPISPPLKPKPRVQ